MKKNSNVLVHLPLPRSLQKKERIAPDKGPGVLSKKTDFKVGDFKVVKGVLALPIKALELSAKKKLILESKSGVNIEIHGLNNLIESTIHQSSVFVDAKQNTTKVYFGKTTRKRPFLTVPVKISAKYQNNELKFYGLNNVTSLVNLNFANSKWEKVKDIKITESSSRDRSFANRIPRKTLAVGIWDLGAWLGSFPAFLELMNKAQRSYKFTPVTATVPAGMLRRREGVLNWLKEATNSIISDNQVADVMSNTIANDYFVLAEKIRTDLSLDYLVGITPGMIAGIDNNEVYWNHFSSMEERLLIASTYDLRKFSSEANRPFDLFLAEIVVAQLLVAQFHSSGLGYHRENRGCLFDYNGDRESLKKKVTTPHIDQDCLKLIPASYRSSILSLLNFFIKQSKPSSDE